MRTETYMVVDPRHDHSLRVPRPDLTLSLGTPNACNDCHRDRSPRWAEDAIERWYPEGRWTTPHYGETLQAGRNLEVGAGDALAALAANRDQPGIVRATAVSLLPRFPGPTSTESIVAAAGDADPLVRLAAASDLDALEPGERLRVGAPLLSDPLRAVRVDSVVPLADVPAEDMSESQRVAFDRAMDEFLEAQQANAERPEAHVNLGLLSLKRGDLAAAERAYEAALRLGPWFVPAYANLADLYRQQGRDDEGEALLRKGLEIVPESSALYHALGLLLVRQKRVDEAMDALRRAADLTPDDPQLAYVYAIGLHSTGRTEEALEVLARAHERAPSVAPVLVALATIHRDRGDREEALEWARKLLEVTPDDPGARQLVASLGG